MKRVLCSCLVAGCLLWNAPAFGQGTIAGAPEIKSTPSFEKQGPSTYTFLKVTPTARVAAMGDASTAVVDGIEAIQWNPAGIARIDRFGYSLGYTQWVVDSKFWSGAIAYNVGWSTVVGLSVISFQPATIMETTTLAPTGTGKEVDVGDTAAGLSVARQLTDKMSAGLMVRYVQSKLGAEKISGVTLNVGTQFHTGFRSLRLGMSMKNLGGEEQLVSEKSTMPTVFHVGTAMEVYGDLGDPVSVTAAFEGAYFTDRWQRWNLGGEMWFQNLVALRAGYKFRYDEETWSVGGGLKGSFSGHTIWADFSYTNFGDLLEAPIRLTLSGSF